MGGYWVLRQRSFNWFQGSGNAWPLATARFDRWNFPIPRPRQRNVWSECQWRNLVLLLSLWVEYHSKDFRSFSNWVVRLSPVREPRQIRKIIHRTTKKRWRRSNFRPRAFRGREKFQKIWLLDANLASLATKRRSVVFKIFVFPVFQLLVLQNFHSF